MTQRSILAGLTPTVIIKVGANVTVRGQEGDRVIAETSDAWGSLRVEKSTGTGREIARARAANGEHVFFDLRIKLPDPSAPQTPQEVIEVQLSSNGQVLVPFGANIKVYAGLNIDVQDVRGRVDAFAGAKLHLQDVAALGNASAGWTMDLDCQTLPAQSAEFKAGSDLRFHVRDLTSAHIRIKDLGGYWEAQIGSGEQSVYLKSGGDVTLVTDQEVQPLPPHYILGKIEKPPTV